MRQNLLAFLLSASALIPAAAFAQSTPSDFTTGTRYDLAHRVTGTIAPDPDGAGPLHYAAVRNTYDDAGRLTKVETGELSAWQSETVAPANWSGFTVFRQIETDYDELDRKTVERASSGGTVLAVTQYSYDPAGRLQCTAVRMNPSTWSSPSNDACAPTTSGPDGLDRITKNIYDDAGQLVQVRKAVGTSLEQAYETYSYTSNGKQQDVIDANGNHAKFVYDGFDRQVQWIFPSATVATAFDGSTPANALSTANALNTSDYEQYGYDANGNRTSFRRRDGRVFTLAYDALNRQTKKELTSTSCTLTCTSAPSSALRSVYYGYDLQGHQLYARFDSETGADGVTSTYTGFGELASSTTAMNGTSGTFTYLYDADGNRTRITHPDGNWFGSAYDGLDRLSTMNENGGTQVAGVTYDAQAHPVSETRAGVTSAYSYDGLERLASLSDDLAGTSADVSTSFGYNPASQLSSTIRDNDSYAFTGSVNVNRGYSVNGLNQYTASGSASLSYDANGNLISDGTTSYSYDAENRLVATSAGASLTYDPNGRLWQVSSGSGSTRFLYDGDQLSAEYDASSNLLRRYVHGTSDDDPMIWYEGSGLADRRSLQVNWQGSIVSVADASGNLVGINAYDEYGIPNPRNVGRFQYTGQAWLPELGMYHYKARIYSPTLGRFLQTDPIGYKDQVNLYEYVGDDPVDNVDVTGERLLVRGTPNYRATITREIRQIQSGANGNSMVHALIVSRNEIIISSSKDEPQVKGESSTAGVNHTVAKDSEDCCNGKGTGSNVYYDSKATGGVDINGSNIRPPFVGLAHELGVAEANDTGNRSPNYPLKMTPGTTPEIERNAMRRENQVRGEHNLPQRPTFYPPANCIAEKNGCK